MASGRTTGLDVLHLSLQQLIVCQLAAKGDRKTFASCKLVCKEWRDNVRLASRKLVIGTGERLVSQTIEVYEQLQRAAKENQQVTDLELAVDSTRQSERAWTRLCAALALKDWSNVTVRCPLGNGYLHSPIPGYASTMFLPTYLDGLMSLTVSKIYLAAPEMKLLFLRAPQLKKLIWKGPCPVLDFAEALSSIPSLDQLAELNIIDGSITPANDPDSENATTMLIMLVPNAFPNLEVISFSDGGIVSKEAYLKLTGGLSSLKVLRVANKCPGVDDEVLSSLAHGCSLLQELSLGVEGESFERHSPIGSESLRLLLERCRSLTTLRLPGLSVVEVDPWPTLLQKMGRIEKLECSLSRSSVPLVKMLVRLHHLLLHKPEGARERNLEYDYLRAVASAVGQLPCFKQLSYSSFFWVTSDLYIELQALMPGVELDRLSRS